MKIIMMPDKIIRTGSAPVYDQTHNIIANVHYHFMSFTRKIEIKNAKGELLSTGNIRAFSFRRTWIISNEVGKQIGMIKQLFSMFKKRYVYTNDKGQEFSIEGNVWGRQFKVYKNSRPIISVSSTSDIITLRPHNYQVVIHDDTFDIYEAINLVTGIRNLVELEKSSD